MSSPASPKIEESQDQAVAKELPDGESESQEIIQGEESFGDCEYDSDSTGGAGSSLDLFSALLAVLNSRKACSLHEECDGSCSGTSSKLQPLQPEPKGFSVRTTAAPMLPPEGAIPKDQVWLLQQDLQDFTFDPFESATSSIRLLRIKPAIFRVDVLDCDQIVATLSPGMKYNALSYCWGAAIFDQPIIINGKRTMITSGLQSALKAYRQENELQDQLLWVDAISINQKDTQELSNQLPLMQHIYSDAQLIYIDLGDVDESWYQGYDLMQQLCMIYELESSPGKDSGNALDVATIFERYGLPHRQHPAWALYAQVFGSPWFRRTWILQEVALAAEAKARIGRFLIDWRFFEESFIMFTTLGMHTLPNFPAATGPGILAMFKIQELLGMVRQRPSGAELIRLLRITNNFLVSDPRDKVIGILGLARSPRTQAVIPQMADYTVTTDETYHRLALHLVDRGSTQLMLSHAGMDRRLCITTAPSWVPDWTAQSRDFGPLPLVLFRPQLYQAATAKHMYAKFASLDSSTSPISDTATLQILAVPGDLVDEVACLSEARPCYTENTTPPTDVILAGLLHWIESTRRSLESAYRQLGLTEPFNMEIFARTLLVDDLYTGENATRYSSPILEVENCYLKATALLHETIEDPDRCGALMASWSSPEQTFIQQVIAATSGKRAAVTKGGRMCLLPGSSIVSDNIGIFLGANVPYVLRTSESDNDASNSSIKARLIGDAYVHGIMNGEALIDGFNAKDIHLW